MKIYLIGTEDILAPLLTLLYLYTVNKILKHCRQHKTEISVKMLFYFTVFSKVVQKYSLNWYILPSPILKQLLSISLEFSLELIYQTTAKWFTQLCMHWKSDRFHIYFLECCGIHRLKANKVISFWVCCVSVCWKSPELCPDLQWLTLLFLHQPPVSSHNQTGHPGVLTSTSKLSWL